MLAIEVRRHRMPFNSIEISAFIEEVTSAFGEIPEGHWLEIDVGFGFSVIEFRYETTEEYTARYEQQLAHKAQVQAKADQTWKRQQRKFAKARSK